MNPVSGTSDAWGGPRAKRILFLAPGRAGPSVRFRVEQWRPHLAAHGVASDVGDLDVPLPRRLALLRRASDYDGVIVHRAFLSPPEVLLLRRAGGGFTFDFDDALMFRDSSRVRQRSWQRRARLRRMVRGATRVIAGNRTLADWAATAGARVTVVPTVIDLAGFPDRPPEPGPPVAGWIGSRPNLPYLEAILPRLAGLRQARIRVVCDAPPRAKGIPIDFRPWSLERETEDLRSFRVGLMPLPDDPWTRGKCALKILQCFAAFVPVVCSPVGANAEIVREGENGLFARSPAEWIGAIEQILGDEPLRRRMATAARETVAAGYSVAAHLDRFLEAIDAS